MIVQLNIRQVIHSFSDALDLVGIDEVQHGKRVAFMACECSRALMKMRHSFESYQILRRISGFEEIAKWAAFHHEALAGTGYPLS